MKLIWSASYLTREDLSFLQDAADRGSRGEDLMKRATLPSGREALLKWSDPSPQASSTFLISTPLGSHHAIFRKE